MSLLFVDGTLFLVPLNKCMSEWGDEDENAGDDKDARVGVAQLVEQTSHGRTDDAADASEEDDQPEGGGEQVKTEQVHQDDGRQGHVRCWHKVQLVITLLSLCNCFFRILTDKEAKENAV